MKKIIFVLGIVLISTTTKAQWNGNSTEELIWRNGNVGIGTSNNTAKLSIHDNTSTSNWIRFTNSNTGQGSNNGAIVGIDGNHDAAIWNYENTALYIGTNNQRRLTISPNGNIGIGTLSMAAKLSIHDNTSTSNWIRFTNSNTGQGSNNGAIIGIDGNHDAAIWNYENTALYIGTNNQRRMTISSNGSIGIGTISTGTHRLAVQGSIGAREIKVEASGWSDFVFKNDYELRTLEEVEQHINENGHLPEIPSEEEVNENGINLGEMDAKLLQKIEELTLYMIDMNKRVNELEQENSELKESNNELKEKVKSLEKNKDHNKH